MENSLTDALDRTQKLLILYSEFFGHCQGLLDIRDGNWISDFDVVVRLHELVAEYEALIKEQK